MNAMIRKFLPVMRAPEHNPPPRTVRSRVVDGEFKHHPIPISERVKPQPYKKRKTDQVEERKVKLTLRNPIHGTEYNVMIQAEDGGTISRHAYARAWRKLCPTYGPDNQCECGGVHSDPDWLVTPDGPLQVGDAPLYTRCDWLVTRRPQPASATSVTGRLAYRFAAWIFTVCLPYTVVYSIVIVRGLFSFFFSWKFFTIMMLCFTLFVVEYVLRAQP